MCRGRAGARWRLEASLGSRSSVLLDLDGDGDQDIVTSDFNSRPQLLLSDLAQKSKPNWLAIELRGTQSNRDGLGSRVEIDLDSRTLVRYINGKVGYLSQASFASYFGLGESKVAKRIRILWPSGCQQVLEGPHESGATVVAVEECATQAQ